MLKFRPRTNAERQREFLKRNPGYYRRYRLKHNANIQVLGAITPAETPAPAIAQSPLAPAPIIPVAPVSEYVAPTGL